MGLNSMSRILLFSLTITLGCFSSADQTAPAFPYAVGTIDMQNNQYVHEASLACSKAMDAYNKGRQACSDLYAAGAVTRDMKSGQLQNCENGIKCDDTDTFQTPPTDPDSASVTQAQLLAFAANQSGDNPYAETYKTTNNTIDKDKAISTSTCNGFTPQQRADFLALKVVDLNKKLGAIQEEMEKKSKEIDEAQGKMRQEQEMRTKEIQAATLDYAKAQSDLLTAVQGNNNNSLDSASQLQKEFRLEEQKIRDNTAPSGTNYTVVLNGYQNDVQTALALCENNLKKLMARGKITVSSLNALGSLALPGTSISNNIFANNGQITTQYCAADNTYIMAKSAAYRKYLAGLGTLNENVRVARIEMKRITDKEIVDAAKNANNNRHVVAEINDRMAKDQLTQQNDNQILEAEKASAAQGAAALQLSINALNKRTADIADAIARDDAQLDGYKSKGITAHTNDITAEKAERLDKEISEGIAGYNELSGEKVDPDQGQTCQNTLPSEIKDQAKTQYNRLINSALQLQSPVLNTQVAPSGR